MNNTLIDQRLETVKTEIQQLSEQIANERELINILKSGKEIEDYIRISKLQKTYTVEEYLKYRDEISDKTFFEKVKPLLDEIPESNGSRYYQKLDVNIGMIADEFLFQAYNNIANINFITKENYKDFDGKLDIFLIASAWKGLDEEWRGLANPKNTKLRDELNRMIQFFREQGTKIVFYSKEDPVNYDRFVDIAKNCDYIFTTASEKLEDYKADCQNENVFLLEFGVNPLYHNPVGVRKYKKREEVLFAGSWYEKYKHRQEETRMIFDGVLESGRELKIIDRNFSLNNSNYFFPKMYLSYVSPSVTHEYLQKLHKLFDWSINLNSIKYSDTMFANRVYELQAIGNLILSNYSVGVNNKFPNVFLINESNEVKEILNGYDEEEIFRQQSHGIRRVMTSETTFDRLEFLMERIGLTNKKTIRKVAVVVKEMNDDIQGFYNRQTYAHKELIIEKEFTQEVKDKFDIIAYFSPSRQYDEFYLQDMVNGFKYTDSDYITKDSYYDGEQLCEGVQHDFVDIMKDRYRTVFWSKSFTLEELINLEEGTSLPNGYSIDPFEYNVSQSQVLTKVKDDPELSVIIPIYNNGEHLLNKCFNSLKRSSIFKYMEILLVDDGSAEQKTLDYVKRLDNLYENVKTYYFNDNGSGSASRARNKGFELSTAPFITYLDPDNEAVNDGYAVLLDTIKGSQYDMVVGNISRLDNRKSVKFNYYNTVIGYAGNSVINNTKQFLIDSNLKAQSIQAVVVKREIIGNNNIKMVLNAGGQDTLFFHELLLNSNIVKAIDLDIHLYYAAVTGSVTNSISKMFFNKYRVLEKYRIPFLKEQGLMKTYMETRFNYYFKHWYMKRLPRLKDGEEQEAIEILYDIYLMYKDYLVVNDEMIESFAKLASKKEYKKIINFSEQIS